MRRGSQAVPFTAMTHEYFSEPVILAAFGAALLLISIVLRVAIPPHTDQPQK